MFTIVGSGFGLYGYLPALVESLGAPVLLPRAYHAKVSARPELVRYLDAIRWVADANAAMAAATGIVVATPPRRQAEVVGRCLRYPELRTFVLEKPVGTDPETADELLAALKRAGKRYRIGYTLLHAAWNSRLELLGPGEVAITWTFMAHHFANALHNWKREHAEGGGVLRFFGVHLLALLVNHGYRDVEDSVLGGEEPTQPERWRAVFSGPGLPECRVAVDSRHGMNGFRVALKRGGVQTLLVDLKDPFEHEVPPATDADRRVAVLQRLLDTFNSADGPYFSLYDDVTLLWRKVEVASSVATVWR